MQTGYSRTIRLSPSSGERRNVVTQRLSFIRFRWLDDEYEREYFELKMTNNELTNDFVLEVTDFAAADEVKDLRELWDSQVDTLRRTCAF